MLVSTSDLDLAAWGIEVFPNPTADFLTVRFASDKGHGVPPFSAYSAKSYFLMGGFISQTVHGSISRAGSRAFTSCNCKTRPRLRGFRSLHPPLNVLERAI